MQILIGRFVECQSIKKVGGRRSVEELYQSETKIEPDRRLRGISLMEFHYFVHGSFLAVVAVTVSIYSLLRHSTEPTNLIQRQRILVI